MKTLIFDIETLPRSANEWEQNAIANPDSIDTDELRKRSGAPSTWKDHEKMANKLKEKIGKSGLDPNMGSILSIAWAIDGEPVQVAYAYPESQTDRCESEHDVIQAFLNAVEHVDTLSKFMWVGHNILSFDLVWLWRRCVKYGFDSGIFGVPHEKFSKFVQDTMVMWGGTDYRDMTSLQTIADFLGIDGKSDGVDGSKIAGLYAAGEHQRIIDYAKQDVELTRQVYARMESTGNFERMLHGAE